MKYRQIDKIIALQPGSRLVGERTLLADEEYLSDHFPNLPVMPGVMMLEALHQAAIWLVRSTLDFQCPMVFLREARSVKFGDFLSPGETLRVTAEIKSRDGDSFRIKAVAAKEGRVTVSAILHMDVRSSGDPARLNTDEELAQRCRNQFQTLFGCPQDIPEVEAA
ncbi:3-hydroxyacyl-ACP dehydratase FabZ family protein [Crateriforma conspicua]|uniref:3-hydroxyacyl-[acyl-carrier-protein] dehydratase FabZ n=1 Tax=Crateriforma conspicua TaxID=2527996 RepID=A0A5C5YAY8_9PLAN|nr:3-hydroxyacyl-ACP dehydratase FabZ family protein [Crateriforma conspicua]QDV61209.1 3-hydroxyacyl-[acyl-carrier-protein] dehydratase FabZ [Crateriforma conspicua]TWT72540.1 3-hydroxyacyl-[acyl-carrier-protein] dehydratase FabZ [Crateriforma conspicua]